VDLAGTMAAELVAMRVDLIYAYGGTRATQAAKKATSTIPIVFLGSDDPVGYRLVATLARPGGNVTGTSGLGNETAAKRVEILVEAIRGSRNLTLACVQPRRVRDFPTFGARQDAQSAASRSLGARLEYIDADSVEQLESSLERLGRQQVGGVLFDEDEIWAHERARIASMFVRQRLAAMSDRRDFVAAGMLMSYSISGVDLARKAAVNVDRILSGAHPADLPVEQVSKWDFVINLKAATLLGLKIPQSTLQRADEVIQ